MLVVLDNFEHVLAARDAVIGLLEACPGLVALVTSRTALRVRAGREYPVAPLALPAPGDEDGGPAVQLFLDRAEAAGVELAPDAAVIQTGLAYRPFTGDAARAGALTEESLAAARRSQDRLILAQALFFLGRGASNTGAYERAEALGTEALELFAELGEAGEHAEALFGLGTIAMFTGDYRRAVGLFEQSLAERRGRGDEHTAARHLGGAGRRPAQPGRPGPGPGRAGGKPGGGAPLRRPVVLGHVADAARPPAAGRGRPGPRPGRADRVGGLFASTGNMVYLTWCLEGLAGVAAADRRFGRAAEIAGARDALRAQTGVLLPPVHPAAYEPTLAAVRDNLGADGFTAAHATAGGPAAAGADRCGYERGGGT